MRKRALLVAGGISPAQTQSRYRRNLELFRGLLQERGYEVRALLEDGPAGFEAATRAHFDEALAWGCALSEGDRFVLVVSNHGDEDGFCLWGRGEMVAPEDLAAGLAGCEAEKLLIFGQCCAGVFGGTGISRAVTLMACSANEYTQATWPDAQYGEFLRNIGKCFREADDATPKDALAAANTRGRWVAANEETPWLDDPDGLAGTFRL